MGHSTLVAQHQGQKWTKAWGVGGWGNRAASVKGAGAGGSPLEMGCGAWALEPALLALGVPLEEGLWAWARLGRRRLWEMSVARGSDWIGGTKGHGGETGGGKNPVTQSGGFWGPGPQWQEQEWKEKSVRKIAGWPLGFHGEWPENKAHGEAAGRQAFWGGSKEKEDWGWGRVELILSHSRGSECFPPSLLCTFEGRGLY